MENELSLGLALAATHARLAPLLPPPLALLRLNAGRAEAGRIQPPLQNAMAWLMPAWYWWSLPTAATDTAPAAERPAPSGDDQPTSLSLPTGSSSFTYKPARPVAAEGSMPQSLAQDSAAPGEVGLPSQRAASSTSWPLPAVLPDSESGGAAEPPRESGSTSAETSPRFSVRLRHTHQTNVHRVSEQTTAEHHRSPLAWVRRREPAQREATGRSGQPAAVSPERDEQGTSAAARMAAAFPWRQNVPRPLAAHVSDTSTRPNYNGAAPAVEAGASAMPNDALPNTRLTAIPSQLPYDLRPNRQPAAGLIEVIEQLVAQETQIATQENFVQLQSMVREQLTNMTPPPDMRLLARQILDDEMVTALVSRLEGKYKENQFRIGKLGRTVR